MPDMTNNIAIVGLGANLANPVAMISEALSRLSEKLHFIKCSSIFLTEPQGGPEQDWYHNAVAFFKSDFSPQVILKMLLSTEADLGRVRLELWGPRIIDLDLLAFGKTIINDPPELILPHPKMHQRLFVMEPLAEVAPDWRHPVLGKTACDILKNIQPNGQGFKKLGSLSQLPKDKIGGLK